MYYKNKYKSLCDLFGTTDIVLNEQFLRVKDVSYPIVDDVIILLDSNKQSPYVRNRLSTTAQTPTVSSPHPFAKDIQHTFGAEWTAHGEVLPEHEKEFSQYFDLVDLNSLRAARICDLGCGSGRWSYFLKNRCKELVLVDFSDAIFVARKNLFEAENALFFNGDLTQLPFADHCADFLFCLGVLHHLPVPCLDAVRSLHRLAPRLLIFLYYALDNRPFYFRWILIGVTIVRQGLARLPWTWMRSIFSWIGTVFIYLPLIALGYLLSVVGWGRFVPLFEFYRGKSMKRIRQDVYDRFFTRIEQRVSRRDIDQLRDTFGKVTISPHLPYWHFICDR